MKGIDWGNSEGLADSIGTYTVGFTIGGNSQEAVINDHEIGNVENYSLDLIDEAMIDYTQAYADLSSMLHRYEQSRISSTNAYKDHYNRRYVDLKSKPFLTVAKSANSFGKQSLAATISDSHIKAMIETESKTIELRGTMEYFDSMSKRLNRSIAILERAWDTARSLNANNRKSLGG